MDAIEMNLKIEQREEGGFLMCVFGPEGAHTNLAVSTNKLSMMGLNMLIEGTLNLPRAGFGCINNLIQNDYCLISYEDGSGIYTRIKFDDSLEKAARFAIEFDNGVLSLTIEIPRYILEGYWLQEIKQGEAPISFKHAIDNNHQIRLKFKLGDTVYARTVAASNLTLDYLHSAISTLFGPSVNWVHTSIKYKDDADDCVLIDTPDDVEEMIKFAHTHDLSTMTLLLSETRERA